MDLRNGWLRKSLSDVCDVSPRDPALRQDAPFVPMASVEVGQRFPTAYEPRGNRGGVRARADDVLFARITPCLENGKLAQLPADAPPTGGSTEFIVVRPGPLIDPAFLYYWCQEPSVRADAQSMMTGATGRMRLSAHDLGEFVVDLPRLEEQRRIVEILEDHLSHLDAAEAQLALADRKCEPLITAVLQALVPVDPTVVPLTAVADAGELKLGRQRHPDWHMGPNMKPYLRVANVFEDRIDLSDVKSMDFTGVFNNFQLRTGDVLLNEGQSPEYLGRPAIYRGEPSEVAFTNTLIRFRAHADVLPEWALLVFRRHMRSGRFIRESRITTNIAHLSLKRLATVEFPLPSLGEQARLVQRADELLGGVLRMHEEVAARRTQAASLRRSLLSAAFSGRLTGASADQATIEELASA